MILRPHFGWTLFHALGDGSWLEQFVLPTDDLETARAILRLTLDEVSEHDLAHYLRRDPSVDIPQIERAL